MPRKATGTTFADRTGRRYARVRVGPGPKDRRAFQLPQGLGEEEADRRTEALAGLATRLRAAAIPGDAMLALLEKAAGASDADLAGVLTASDRIITGARKLPSSAAVTFQALGERWTRGELAALYPDHIKPRKRAGADAADFERHVYPIVRGVRIVDFTLDHALAVMAGLPSTMEPGTRRNYAQRLHQVLGMAVFPLRLITSNPIPRGFMPKRGGEKAKGYLYPDEEAQLVGCPLVPLHFRMLWAFLHREGCRSASEALAFRWRDLDLERGVVTLDHNKTGDARAWTLSTTSGLRAWRELRRWEGGAEAVALEAPVFVDPKGGPIEETHLARRFRAHLAAAGVERATLTETHDTRMRIRAHDTRATFITLALANGRTETWVADRTGHRSSDQIATYRRAARTAAEAGLGDLAPVQTAIPELAAALARMGSASGSNPADRQAKPSKPRPKADSMASFQSDDDTTAHPTVSAGIEGGEPAGGGLGGPAVAQSGGAVAHSSPRAGLAADLTRRLEELLVAGDLGGARVAHQALGALLGEAGPVVNLVDQRRRRR